MTSPRRVLRDLVTGAAVLRRPEARAALLATGTGRTVRFHRGAVYVQHTTTGGAR